MIDMSLSDLVKRRCRDYEIETPEELAKVTGLSKQHAWLILTGRTDKAGIITRRALARGLDLDPDVIERSVRVNA